MAVLAGAGTGLGVGQADAPARMEVAAGEPPTAASEVLPTAASEVLPSLPVRLDLPAVGVSTALVHLGLTPEGALQVPGPGPHLDQAGWYRGSPRPGARGPAVIAGHVDSARAGPSVFYRLAALRAGDLAVVTGADGSTSRFVVDAVGRYPKDRFPTRLVYGNTAGAELRLITCGGDFDRSSGHYRDNVVVTAHLVAGGTPPLPKRL